MASSTRPTAIRRERRFETADEPRAIPQSWVDYAPPEPIEADQVPCYAIQVQGGYEIVVETRVHRDHVLDETVVSRTPALAVLYATAAGDRAVERRYEPVEGATGYRPPRSEYVSVAACDPPALEPVRAARQAHYRELVHDRHDVDAEEGVVRDV